MTRRLVVLLTLVLMTARPATGQIVRGTVHEAESGRVIESGVVTLLDGDGATIRAVLTDSLGDFAVRAPAPGAYRLRFERLGFRPVITDRFMLDEGETESRAIRAEIVSVSLERIVVSDRPRCRILREADTLTARVWSAVRSVLASTAAAEAGLYPHVTIERYVRTFDYRRNMVTKERKWTTTGVSAAPFVALAARDLEQYGFVRRAGDSVTFYAPDARTLMAEEFLRTHCFRVRDDRAVRGRVGLDIEPTPRRTLPDIKGTLWLDPATGELRRLEFVYVNLPPYVPREDAEGWVEFRRVPRGAWVVDRWALRLPFVGQPPAAATYGAPVPTAGESTRDRAPQLLGSHEEGGRIVSMEEERRRPRTAGASAATVAVRGFVRTTAGGPVAGARAFLSGTGYSSVSDAEGAFAMLEVTPGRYQLSFTHPRFDTLDVVGPVVEIDASDSAQHTLTMPTDADIARSVCVSGLSHPPTSHTLLYGYVRDGTSTAVSPDVRVRATWRVTAPRGPTVGVRNETAEVQSDASGRYQLCGIPSDTPFTIRASAPARRIAERRIDALLSPVTRVDLQLPKGRM
jgi:hypothetical protein